MLGKFWELPDRLAFLLASDEESLNFHEAMLVSPTIWRLGRLETAKINPEYLERSREDIPCLQGDPG